MTRTKQNRQKLGGKLQSARAKHDTALEQEILGQIAAQKAAKIAAKVDADGGKPSGKTPGSKRSTKRQQLTELLSSGLGVDDTRCGDIIKRANHRFTMKQMYDAAVDAHESTAGRFTEADFLAKAEEYTGAGPQGSDPSAKAARKAKKVEKKLRKTAKKAKAAAEKSDAKKTAKKAAKAAKDAKEGEVLPDSAEAHNPEPSEVESKEIRGGTAATNGGFSTEFWMGLAGSREAAVIAPA